MTVATRRSRSVSKVAASPIGWGNMVPGWASEPPTPIAAPWRPSAHIKQLGNFSINHWTKSNPNQALVKVERSLNKTASWQFALLVTSAMSWREWQASCCWQPFPYLTKLSTSASRTWQHSGMPAIKRRMKHGTPDSDAEATSGNWRRRHLNVNTQAIATALPCMQCTD